MLDVKRKLDELITIYKFEDELLDVFVEGPSDKFILKNFYEYKNIDKTIIEIDTIDLSDVQSIFPELDFKSNRDKLIALAKILAESNVVAKINCIIDRDFDGTLYPEIENEYLNYTDYACIESYIFCKRHIDKLITVGIRNFPQSVETIIKEISKVLSSLFIMRMINKHFNFNYNFPKIESHINVNKTTGICDFDFTNYLEIYINTNKLKEQKDDITQFVKNITEKLKPDYRFNMNGHDFIEVLFNYVNKIKNTPNYRLENFERTLYLSIQPNYLEDYPLFKKIS